MYHLIFMKVNSLFMYPSITKYQANFESTSSVINYDGPRRFLWSLTFMTIVLTVQYSHSCTNLITFFYVEQLSIHYPQFCDQLNLHIKSIYVFLVFQKVYIYDPSKYVQLAIHGPKGKTQFQNANPIFVLTCTLYIAMGCV